MRHRDLLTAQTGLLGIVAVYVVVAVLAYARHYFFLYDDTALVAAARDVGFGPIFATPLVGFYRPMAFVLLKVQYAMFGWDRPGGYAAVSVAAHAVSVVGFHGLVREAGYGPPAALVSALLLLASPWASEATCWLSSQFDLFAVAFGVLAALLFAQHLRTPSLPRFGAAVLLFTAALLCKENAVVFGVAFAALGVRRFGRAHLLHVFVLLVPFGAATLAYFVLRASALSAFGGSYGNLATLYAEADLGANVASFVKALLLLNRKFEAAFAPLSFVYTAAALAALVAAAAKRPVVFCGLALLLSVLLVPVLWADVSTRTTTSGRFLYAPGMAWSLLIGIGAAAMLDAAVRGGGARARPTRPAILAILCGMLATAFASSVSQTRLWRVAAGLARESVAYVISRPEMDAPLVHISNLPRALDQGPFLLRAYNLIHHMRAAGRARTPEIVAETFIVSVMRPGVLIPAGRDATANPGPGASAAVIALPLEDLLPRP